MGRKTTGRPTDTEMEILRILWDNGGQTVRQVHGELKQTRQVAYSTVLTQLQFMHQKGLVIRDETYRSHIYKAAKPKAQTERSFVRSILNNCFGGSASSLVLNAMSLKKIPPEEIERIRQLFQAMEGEEQ